MSGEFIGRRMGDFVVEGQREASIDEMKAFGVRPPGRAHFDAMTKAEQDEALGPDVAEAVRKGDISLADTVTTNHTDTDGDDFITQASPKELGIETESKTVNRDPDTGRIESVEEE